eukprot:6223106-Pyramimonas_sp.AAC.1
MEEHGYYKKGIHTPMHFIFWNFNDIVDGAGELNGVGAGPQRQENPTAFAGSLRILVEAAVQLAVQLVDDERRSDRDNVRWWRPQMLAVERIWRKPDVG